MPGYNFRWKENREWFFRYRLELQPISELYGEKCSIGPSGLRKDHKKQ